MTPLRRRFDEARLAVILLTRLPMGRLADPVPSLGAAAWAYPFVGLIVGMAGWAAQAVALVLGLAPDPAALIAVAVMALLTGGLHLDGLADLADGLGGGRDRAHALEIMRDSRIGTYGAVTLILAIGLQAAALAQFAAGMPLLAFLLAGVVSRLAMTAALHLLPQARADGLGKSAGGTGDGTLVPRALVCVGLTVALGAAWLIALAAAAAMAALVVWRTMRRLGGQTGDVLGAVQMIAEIACLLALSAALAP